MARARIPLLLVFLTAAVLGGAAAPGPQTSIRPGDIQAGLDAVEKAGGGIYRLPPGAKIADHGGVIVPPGVTLDLNGGELIEVLDEPNAAGVRLMTNSTLANGEVTVVSQGVPGMQGGAHAPVLIGALYGENARGPSRFEGPSGWHVRNVTLRSDKLVQAPDGTRLGAPAVQIMGGAHDGIVEGVTVPDSSVMAGGIHLDWGTVGPIASGDVPASARAFKAGIAYTTHPHDIVIRDVHIGRLTRPSVHETGSFGIRLSGVRDVRVSDVTIRSVTEAGIYNTAGDLGFEFALPADRARAHRGITVANVVLDNANGAYLVRSDSNADNVSRAAAAGYAPMLEPIAETDIVVRNVTGTAGGPRPPNFGLRVDHERGGHFSDIIASGFRRGFYIDEQVFDVTLERPVARASVEAAISIEHPFRPPARIEVIGPIISGDNEASRRIVVGRSQGVSLVGARDAHVVVTEGARDLKRD